MAKKKSTRKKFRKIPLSEAKRKTREFKTKKLIGNINDLPKHDKDCAIHDGLECDCNWNIHHKGVESLGLEN